MSDQTAKRKSEKCLEFNILSNDSKSPAFLSTVPHDTLANEIRERIELRHGEARAELINKFTEAIGRVDEDGKSKSFNDLFGPIVVQSMFRAAYRKAFDAGYDLSSSRRVIIDSAADYEREYNAWFEKHWEAKS